MNSLELVMPLGSHLHSFWRACLFLFFFFKTRCPGIEAIINNKW